MDSETSNDQVFLSKLLPDIEPLLVNKIPNLMMEGRHPHNLYTKETCTEFHLLLCELLEKFAEYLNDIQALQTQTSIVTVLVLDKLNLILRVGTTLRLMVRGAAIKKHLKVIENFLPDRLDLVKQKEGGGRDEDDKDREDEEFVALHSNKPLPRWKTCIDWLELMVIHFDAIQVLICFVGHRSNKTINIAILSQCPPDARMLSWR
jgi:hypothetical protein